MFVQSRNLITDLIVHAGKLAGTPPEHTGTGVRGKTAMNSRGGRKTTRRNAKAFAFRSLTFR
ncbi:hypothetical protein YC2023_049023 [Brassica napus]